MNIKEFYLAIRHKFEPETLSTANKDSLTYGTRRYLKLFTENGHKPLFISRNIPAIFLGPFWFLYCRMYIFALIFPIIWFAIEYGIRHYTKNDIIVDCLELTFCVYVSLFANSLYINTVRNRFAKGVNSAPSRYAIYAALLGITICIILMLVALKMYFMLMGR